MRVSAEFVVRSSSGLLMLALGVASCAPFGLVLADEARTEAPSARPVASGATHSSGTSVASAGATDVRPALSATGDDGPSLRGDAAPEAPSGRTTAAGAADVAGDSMSAYPLDGVPRAVPPVGRVRCDTSALVSYRGTSLRLQAPVRVHQAFIPYVQRFEALAREVAAQIYGRPPRSMAHAGAFNCRRIRGADAVLSEHALGNAIDLRGFDFGAATSNQPLPADVPGRFSHSFRVRVEDHWVARDARWTVHERFFAALRMRLEADPDLFTVMLGPSFPGHRNHLHFDRAPFRFVQF